MRDKNIVWVLNEVAKKAFLFSMLVKIVFENEILISLILQVQINSPCGFSFK